MRRLHHRQIRQRRIVSAHRNRSHDTTHAIPISEQLTKAADMTFGPSSMLPDTENASYMSKTPGPDPPNLPTFPSLPTSISPAFYLTPNITRALQQMPTARPVSPLTFRSFSDPPNPDQDTPGSDYNTAESFRDNQTVKSSSNNAFTSGIPHQESPKDPNYAAEPVFGAQEESKDLKEQDTIRQQKEKEAGARVSSTGIFQAGSLVSDPRLMRKMLELQEAQLERKDRELAAAQKSNAQLRTSLSDMKDKLAGAQAKLDQKNIYISACDKKIDALQKKIALLTRPYTGPTVGQLRTDTQTNANAEPQLHKPTSKPEKISIPPTQPPAEVKAVDRSLRCSQFSMPRKTETKTASEREVRLNGVNYETPSEEKEASFIQACERSLRRQAELEGRYMLSARSEKRRRVAKGYLWANQEPSKDNGEPRQEDKELREELDQARAANISKPGHVSVHPEISEGALDIVSQQEIPETSASHTEADRVRDTEGKGHGDTGQRANSLLSQKSSCSSDWENVEGVDLEKEWPYACW